MVCCFAASCGFQEERYDPIVPVQLKQMPVKPKRKRILVHEAGAGATRIARIGGWGSTTEAPASGSSLVFLRNASASLSPELSPVSRRR